MAAITNARVAVVDSAVDVDVAATATNKRVVASAFDSSIGARARI